MLIVPLFENRELFLSRYQHAGKHINQNKTEKPLTQLRLQNRLAQIIGTISL